MLYKKFRIWVKEFGCFLPVTAGNLDWWTAEVKI